MALAMCGAYEKAQHLLGFFVGTCARGARAMWRIAPLGHTVRSSVGCASQRCSVSCGAELAAEAVFEGVEGLIDGTTTLLLDIKGGDTRLEHEVFIV